VKRLLGNARSALTQDVEFLRQQLAERDAAIAELYAKTLQIENLKAQLAVLRRSRYGRSSEKLDQEIEQLELLLGELEEGVGEGRRV
jgi:transposase